MTTATKPRSRAQTKPKVQMPKFNSRAKSKGGRPPLEGGPRVQLNTRTQLKTRDRLKQQADRRGVSVSYMVERALQESLTRWEAEKLVSY